MKVLGSYFRDRIGVVLLLSMLFLLLTGVFALYGYDLTAVLYGFLLSLVLIFGFAAVDFRRYRKRLLQLRRFLRGGKTDPGVVPSPSELAELSPPRSEIERSLLLLLQGSLRAAQEQQTRQRAAEQEQEAYYTLWVHQVKTPISAMQLSLQGNPAQESLLLRQELFKIQQYTEMALGYLRISAVHADLQLEPVDLHALVSESLKKFAPLFVYRRLRIQLGAFSNRVISDKKWLQFVLEQLLSNGLKYTKTGGISIRMDQEDRLFIQDSGIGIAPQDLPRIFSRGFTGQNGRLDQSATGLGLFLVKKVMDRLGHGIEIRSERNRGTLCCLDLHRSWQEEGAHLNGKDGARA